METKLNRSLNFIDIYLIALGYIIGAGIFILIGSTTKYAGKFVWISFLIAGILSILNGLTYCDLSTIFKKSGGEYDYISTTLGPNYGIFTSILIILISIFTATTVSLALGKHLNKFLNINSQLLAIALIILFAIINIIGVKTASIFNSFAAIIEISALIAIIFGGLPKIKSDTFFSLPNNWNGVIFGSVIAMFAYTGFETTVKLTEEAINPDEDIPKAVISSILSSIVLYVLIAIVIVSLIKNPKTITNSTAPLIDVSQLIYGENCKYIFSIIALFSISNTGLLSILGSSRMLYGMSDKYQLLKPLRYVNDYTKTPVAAIFFIAILSILCVSIKNVDRAASITSYIFFMVLILINIALIKIYLERKHDEQLKNSYTWNINKQFPILPVLSLLVNVFILGYSITFYNKI